MTVFWIVAATLLVLALLFVLPGLVRGPSATAATPAASAPDASRANLSILREQIAQIDAELASGQITEEQHRRARGEIERRVLDEESVIEAPKTAGSARGTAIVLGALIPLFALGVYAVKGNLTALDPQAAVAPAEPGGEVTMAQVEQMVTQLAQKLEGQASPQPGDAEGWTMLARSYTFLQRFPEASRAYGRAIALEPKNAQLLADHADVLAALQGQQLGGEPMRLIEQALQIDPNHPKALALAGSAAFERKDFAGAVTYWNKARQFVPPDSEFARALDGSIAEAKTASQGAGAVTVPGSPGTAGTAAPDAAATTAAAAASGAKADAASPATGTEAQITGRVSLAPALVARTAPTDTVFVFARAAEGPRMPLAIIKRTVADLPITYTLDDSTAMSPQMKLSAFPMVVVGARISRSGNATPQPGDLQGQTAPTKIGSSGIDLVIDTVQP